MTLLQRLELTGGEQVHPSEQGQAPLHQLRTLLEGLDGVVVGELGDERIGVGLVTLADQALGVADAPLDVAAGAVVVLVGLAQPFELGGGIAPRLVDTGLTLGDLAFG